VEPDGCEFIICLDDGKASEFNTLLLTDWVAHTPPEILAANFGVPADAFSKTAQSLDFQGQVPGSLQDDRAAFVLDVGDRPAVYILGQLFVGMGMSAIGMERRTMMGRLNHDQG
jgi:oxalate decarboxylase